MSTIKTETLSTPSNATVPVDTVVNGTAKAWVNFNGTGTVAIRRAFNVSSITDLGGSGSYRINFTTAMLDTNYAVCFGQGWNGTREQGYQNMTTTTMEVVTGYTSNTSGGGTGTDNDTNSVAIFS